MILHCCGNVSTVVRDAETVLKRIAFLQEESYNPFYSLVMQRLLMQKASIAHSFSITLQFALWDFFREMGESEVGGQERVTNNSNDNSDHIVDSRRAQNIARSYGWWLGKGNLSLTILKVVASLVIRDLSIAEIMVAAYSFHDSPTAIQDISASYVYNPIFIDSDFFALVDRPTAQAKQAGYGANLSQCCSDRASQSRP